MTIYRSGPAKKFYFQYQRNGRFYRGGGVTTYSECLHLEAISRAEVFHPEKITLEKLLEKYVEFIEKSQTPGWVLEKKQFIEKNCSEWLQLSISKITRVQIEEKLKCYSPNKANKFLTNLKSLLNYAVRTERLANNPADNIARFPVTEAKRYVPPLSDFLKVLDVAKGNDKKFLQIMFLSGSRLGEMEALRWSDTEATYLYLASKKNNHSDYKRRKIPLCAMAQDILNELRSQRTGEFVFVNKREQDRFWSRPKLMAGLCKKAGVRPFGFHSIRHLSASMMCNNGTSIKDISCILGHASVTTTEIYLHSIEESVTLAVNKLEDVLKNH